MKKYESRSSVETEKMNTNEIRDSFLIEKMFKKDFITYNYSFDDRVIVGGVMPVSKILSFELSKELGVNFFLERREVGLINIGGEGEVIVESKKYNLLSNDGIYIGVGNKKVQFASKNPEKPMKLYFMSTTGQKEFETKVIERKIAKPLDLGDNKTLNKRTIYQYFHPQTCETNQLLMGMTELADNNVWNTMPTHTHERRMEVYFYFDIPENQRVFHMHGKPDQTRHIIIDNEQAVISPSWSIHGGVGTSKYTFIWAMAGENQTFTDMQSVEMKDLK